MRSSSLTPRRRIWRWASIRSADPEWRATVADCRRRHGAGRARRDVLPQRDGIHLSPRGQARVEGRGAHRNGGHPVDWRPDQPETRAARIADGFAFWLRGTDFTQSLNWID